MCKFQIQELVEDVNRAYRFSHGNIKRSEVAGAILIERIGHEKAQKALKTKRVRKALRKNQIAAMR